MAIGWGRGFGPGMQRPVQQTVVTKQRPAVASKPAASKPAPKAAPKPQAEVAVDVPAPDWDKDPEWKDLPSTEEWIRAVTVNMNEASPGSSRRDKEGNLKVYIAPELVRKGFDARELSGVTVHDHPEDFAEILATEPKKREAVAAQKIARYTDWVDEKVEDPAVRLMLRDTAFHRGPTGAARIVQRAVGFTGDDVDGKWGPVTDSKVAEMSKDPGKFLEAITKARIAYDRPQFGDTEQWPGLVNRFRRVYRNTKKISELAKARNSRVQEQLASILYDQEGS